MEVGFKTDKGRRRSNNEDAFFVMKKDRIFIVADGVGGNNSGEIASHTTVSAIAEYVEKHSMDCLTGDNAIERYFLDCIREVNKKIINLSNKVPENNGMATTVVLAYIHKDILYIMNVGDSRAYVMRSGQMNLITEDHTYVNTLLKAGLITEEEAKNHNQKNMITRAVGADDVIEPDFFSLKLEPKDVILLCTDGLYNEVSEAIMADILINSKLKSDACDMLINTANINGGHDNITLVVVSVEKEDLHE